MATRRTRIILSVAAAIVTLPAFWVARYSWASQVEVETLRASGYGEFTTRGVFTSPCRASEAASAFLAQGPGHPETKGYLCTPLIGPTRILPAPSAPIDWD